MNLVTPENIWEQIRLEKEIQPIIDRIFKEYSTSVQEGIKLDLRQAVWEGICKGKDWE